jgi:endonuclease III
LPGVTEKASELFAILAREYRRLPPLRDLGLLDRLLLLLLAKDATAQRAQAALERLRRDFVDWNELRVSPVFEIQRSLESLEEGDVSPKADRLRRLVSRVFEKKNSLSLDWLKGETPEAQDRFLDSLEALDAYMIHAFLLSLRETDEVAFHQNMSRVLQRIGLVSRTGSPSKALEGIRAIAPPDDLASFQAVLIRLGEELCGPKVVQCERCKALPLCKYGRGRG